MKIWKLACAAALVGCFAATSVAAEEQTLKCKLVTKQISGTFFDVPNVEGVSVGSADYAGVLMCEDGRIAYKEYVLTMENAGKTGSYDGYSTYTFVNGDSLTLKFTGGWSAQRNGGDYEVMSGAGGFEGASGSGTFDKAKAPWKDASLWDVVLTIKTGGS